VHVYLNRIFEIEMRLFDTTLQLGA